MQIGQLKRREFIALLGGAAAWPLAVHAQQSNRVKRLGVLWGLAENDSVYEPHLTAFKQRLQDLGWIDGRNIRVDTGSQAELPSASASRLRNWLRLRQM
jgi:putative tryptophan/tyrosine transport system substrate-binding protein